MEGRWGIADALAADEEATRPSRLAFGFFVSLIVLLFLSVAVARPANALGNDDGVAVSRLDDEEDDEDDEDDDDTDTADGDGQEAAKEEGGEGTGDTSADEGGANQQQANGTKDTDSGGNVQAQQGGDTDSETSNGDQNQAQQGGDTDSESTGQDQNQAADNGDDTDTSGDQDQAAGGGQPDDDVLGDVDQRGPNAPAGPAGPDVLGRRVRRGGPAVAPAVQGRAESRGRQLPFTGAQLGGILAAAAGFVTSGLVLVRKRRRG